MDRVEEQNLREKYKGYGTKELLIEVLVKLEKMRREQNGTGSCRMHSDADDVRTCDADDVRACDADDVRACDADDVRACDADTDQKIAQELGISLRNWEDACATPTGTAMVKFLLPIVFPLNVLLKSSYKGGKVRNDGRKPKEALDSNVINKLRGLVMRRHKFFTQQDFGSAINKKLNQLRNNKESKNEKGIDGEDTNAEITNNLDLLRESKGSDSVKRIKFKVSLTKSKRIKRSISPSHNDEPKQKKLKAKPIANVKPMERETRKTEKKNFGLNEL